MTAQDYAVKHPYGATYSPWSKNEPHGGNDRSTPRGTEVKIGTTVIGNTGSTGLSSGYHIHTQAGHDAMAQSTINPTGHEFQPGIVTFVRNIDQGAWGKVVIIRNASTGVHVAYAHLDDVKVLVGQIIKEGTSMSASQTPVDATTVQLEYNNGLLRGANDGEVKGWVDSKQTVESLQRTIQGSAEHLEILNEQQTGSRVIELLGAGTNVSNVEQRMQEKYGGTGNDEFIETKVYIKK